MRAKSIPKPSDNTIQTRLLQAATDVGHRQLSAFERAQLEQLVGQLEELLNGDVSSSGEVTLEIFVGG